MAIATRSDLRNVAIVAHVDHGKTTLVDAMLRQTNSFAEHAHLEERAMDSNDLEREKGITILAKNTAISYKGKHATDGPVTINVIDTPGHADFGGEVERGLSMVDGVLLLVDASEGPLPQTRFVLKKALDAHLKIIVVINKIDRKDARAEQVLNEIYDLFIDLDATEEQIEFPVLYAVGREGIAQRSLHEKGENFVPLFETILNEIPAPSHDPSEPFQMLVTDLDYSDYLGRLAIGKISNGAAHNHDSLVCLNEDGYINPLRVTRLQVYEGINLKEVDMVEAGDIAILAGIEDVYIGDTICTRENPKALPRITVDEPTVSMRFMANTSPLSGREGTHVQSTRIQERLLREVLRNVAIRIEIPVEKDCFIVKGRGEFQLAILIETMRREGFELCVSRPEVILEYRDGKILEPIEHLFVDCDEEFLGIVTQTISQRKGRMLNLVNRGSGRVRIEFSVPSRGLIGYRDEFLTDTKGTGIMSSYLLGYEEYRGDFASRFTGSLVADRRGTAVSYGLSGLEPRGKLFITPGEEVYEGMIIGEHSRENDIDVNPCKAKKLTNMRAAGKDDNIMLAPVTPMTLERALQFIREDEMVEVTPKSIRLRKTELSASKRHTLNTARKKAGNL